MLRAESHRLRAGDSDSLRNPFFDRRGRSSSMTRLNVADKSDGDGIGYMEIELTDNGHGQTDRYNYGQSEFITFSIYTLS